MFKKINNKGVSLLELIIAIAIMAVLVGVISPMMVKYVEKARVYKPSHRFLSKRILTHIFTMKQLFLPI